MAIEISALKGKYTVFTKGGSDSSEWPERLTSESDKKDFLFEKVGEEHSRP